MAFVDSTPLPVCRLHKSRSHKVCKEFSGYSKNSMGFYYGIKLQLITDIDGIPLSLQFTTQFTTTKTGDRDWLEQETQTTYKDRGYLFVGDKGYQGVEFIPNTLTTCCKIPFTRYQVLLSKAIF